MIIETMPDSFKKKHFLALYANLVPRVVWPLSPISCEKLGIA